MLCRTLPRLVLPLLMLLSALVPGLVPGTSRAAESAPQADGRGVATLVSASDSIAPGRPLRVALRLRLAPGWHTYWRNPGDAGIPPAIDWTLPTGARASEIAWPAPTRQIEGPLVTFGYEDEVLLPVTLTGLAGAARIAAHASWLACKQVCVPEDAVLGLDLPQGDGAPGRDAGLFRAAEAAMPRPSPWPATVSPGGVLELRGPELRPDRVRAALFAADDPDRVAAGAAQALSFGQGHLRLALKGASAPHFDRPLAGVLLLTDAGGQRGAYAVAAMPGAVGAEATAGAHGVAAADDVPMALLLAFAGGLILNCMPCVFPVLAMKAAALAGMRGAPRRQVVLGALAYALGVLVFLCGIGAILAALRQGGTSAGWGFQFAHPLFVAATALLLFAVGLNLSGAFSLDRVGFAGFGQSMTARGGLVGSFFTGALAVLVATPCTAPFMGAALAVALAAPVPVALAVFAALGIGFAAPYVVLAVVPGFARLLPRPGRWMETLRQALAFPMYLTTLWLLWVLGRLEGADAVVLTGAACLLLAAALWLLGRVPGRRAGVAVVALLAAGLWLAQERLRGLAPPPGTLGASAGVAKGGAEPFTAGRLASLRGAGRPVFVDMTAAWCVTCLVNERLALDRASVRAEMAHDGAVLLRGDWTRQDPAITAYLRDQGRDGVPLYVVYPAGDLPPVRLPQILTEQMVLDALRQAAGPASSALPAAGPPTVGPGLPASG